jgi:hypothetical protein
MTEPHRMDWDSVESSRKRTPLWAHEMAPGLAMRWPPPTMLASPLRYWWGHGGWRSGSASALRCGSTSRTDSLFSATGSCHVAVGLY